jgi:uncharacterized protein YdbL (DUF1318 family)
MMHLLVVLALAGCIRAPEIVMVDRATALEQQAAGSFDDIERKLGRAALEPRPAALTPVQLEALGIQPMALTDEASETDADRVDRLLVQHCVGEGRDGLLADTHDACRGAEDRVEAKALIVRVNHARMQLWQWMHEQRSSTSVDELARAWQKSHAGGVACGAWIQGDDGQWHDKAC